MWERTIGNGGKVPKWGRTIGNGGRPPKVRRGNPSAPKPATSGTNSGIFKTPQKNDGGFKPARSRKR